MEKLWAEHIGSLSDYGETYKGFSGSYWSFSRQSIVQSLSRLSEQDEQIALQMFQIILKYAGLGQNGNYTPTLVVQFNLLYEKNVFINYNTIITKNNNNNSTIFDNYLKYKHIIHKITNYHVQDD